MVIGPTPPGAGVMAPATSFTDAKSTSPASEERTPVSSQARTLLRT